MDIYIGTIFRVPLSQAIEKLRRQEIVPFEEEDKTTSIGLEFLCESKSLLPVCISF